MAITITALRNGPFAVEGDLASLSLLDAQGNPFPVEPVEVGGVKRVFLCRCGASEKKPFCDGTHLKVRFQADDRAG